MDAYGPVLTPGDAERNERELSRPQCVARVFPGDCHVTTVAYDAGPPRPPAFSFRHDKGSGLFILTWPDGKSRISAKSQRGSLRSRLTQKPES